MAKVTSPLMSIDASGSIASTIVFSKWKGRNYVRQLVVPANPRSAGQQLARSGVGSAGRFNSYIEPTSDAQVALNAAAPSGQSGVAYFVQKQTERLATSTADYNNVTYSTQAGYFNTAASDMGIVDVTIPGTPGITVEAGLILWNAYSAMFSVDDTLAPTTAITATGGNIDTFQASLEA